MIERMMRRGSTVTAADASAVLRDYFDVSEDLLLDGHRIRTPFGTLALTMRGRFDSETEAFNPGKHRAVLTLQTSAAFRRRLQDRLQVQRRRANVPQPNVTSYQNPNNGDENNTLTPGGCRRRGAVLLARAGTVALLQAAREQAYHSLPAPRSPLPAPRSSPPALHSPLPGVLAVFP